MHYNVHRLNKMDLFDALDKAYTYENLKIIQTTYLDGFYSQLQTEFTTFQDCYVKNKKLYKKKELVYLLVSIFENDRLCEKFVEFLPKVVRELLYLLVWEGDQVLKIAEKKLGCEICEFGKERYGTPEIIVPPMFSLFIFSMDNYYNFIIDKSGVIIFLPKAVIKKLKKHIPAPPEYNVLLLDEIERTQYIYNNEESALIELELALNFIKQGFLKYSKTDKPLLAGIRQMAALLESRGFYENSGKDLEYIKIKLLISLLASIKSPILKQNCESHLLSKMVLSLFVKAKYSFFENICFHLKSHNRQWELQYENNIISKIMPIMVQFRVGKWVSVKNIVKYIFLRDIEMFESMNLEAFYIFYERNRSYSHKDKLFVGPENNHQLLLGPLIKGIIFLFASFGWLEAAYDLPENEEFQVYNKPYLSIYDGVKYARLTKLGEFVFGISNAYTPPLTTKKEIKITLDENRLLLTINGNDKVTKMIIQDMMEKISDSCFKMTYDIFLKQCKSKEDINGKISLFKKCVQVQLPKIWEDFFNTSLARITPLKLQSGLKIYQLGDDRELLHLFAADKILNKNVLKVEGRCVAIQADKLSLVKKRLEFFGYLHI